MAFRDYLRAHPKDAKIYGDLMISLAKRSREDRSAYNAAKGEFVVELTSRAIATQKKGFWPPTPATRRSQSERGSAHE
jgi:GrpB protein